jgi:uncharacterized membrane protein (UPF0136 family)
MRVFAMSHSDSERFSPLVLARILGILSLLGIVTGAFGIGYVSSALTVNGDASATVHNILTHETLFRLGFASHLLELVLNIPAEIIGFLLLRRVNGIVAAIALCCGVVGISIEAVSTLSGYVPLKLAIDAGALGAFSSDQLHAVSYIALQLQDAGLLLSFVFYGLDEVFSGFLIFRSRFLPRVLGVLLAISGLCYFTHGFFELPRADARCPVISLHSISLPARGRLDQPLDGNRGAERRKVEGLDGRTSGRGVRPTPGPVAIAL